MIYLNVKILNNEYKEELEIINITYGEKYN